MRAPFLTRFTAAWALLWLLACPPALADVWTVRSALTAPGSGPTFPTEVSAEPTSLPDEWARTRPGFAGTLWYRVGFQAPPPGEPLPLLAVAIPQVCSAYELHLNGALVHRSGRMIEPFTHDCHQPQLVSLPAGLLAQGANTLDLKVAGHRRDEVGSRWRAGGLSELRIGPRAELEPGHARALALGVDAVQAASAPLLLVGGLCLVLGLIQRQRSQLAYFGMLAVGLALLDSRLWLRQLPLEHRGFEFSLLALLAFVAWGAVQWPLRCAGVRLRWVDSTLPLQCGLVAISVLLAGDGALHVVASFWYVAFALEVALAGLYAAKRQTRAPDRRRLAAVLAVAALTAGLMAASQWSLQRVPVFLAAPWVLSLSLTALGLHQLLRAARASSPVPASANGASHANSGAPDSRYPFEQRLREATAEIERHYRQQAEVQVEQVTERERKRIAADLHDDLGAKLLTIVHTSESQRISSLAREALEEMRLSVRGLTGKPVQLSDALGDWRAETVARLGQAGIEGDWQAPEDLPQRLSSRAYVQTTRILREAVSNIIKHSNATHCSVQCSVTDGDFQVVIQDNGEGIAPEVEGRLDRGHGLASMKNRAKQLQGQCLVESSPGYGTVIRLTLALDRATGAS